MLTSTMKDTPQTALQRLIEDRREDYAALSRMLGRNAAYIQQYIKRGTPRRLHEQDRRILASYFGVSEGLLGGPEDEPAVSLVPVPVLEVHASAGHGAFDQGEARRGTLGFDPHWLRRLTRGSVDALSIILVRGESMMPTLADGDEVIVDKADGADRLRDGIYVLRLDDGLVIKRLARQPAGSGISILSDNPVYPSWPDMDPARIDIVGRVLWYGRRLA